MKTESVNKLYQFTVGKDLIKKAVGDGPEFEILYEAILKQIEANSPKEDTEEKNKEIIYNPVKIKNNGLIDSMPMRLKSDIDTQNKTKPIDLVTVLDKNNNISSNNTNKLNKLEEYNEDEKMKKIYGAIEEYAPKYNVDPNLVLAVIKTESNFNPNCKSSAGAMGLMQLMDFNCETYGVKNPFDINENIRGGIAHLREYLDMYDNNLEMALMAYNGGPGTMARRGVKSPSDLYKMPKETQNYVPKVLKYYEDYKNR